MLVIDRPNYVEVDLNMTCFIRGDVTLNPGQIDFGTVRRSDKLPSAALTLTYSGGRPGWEIAEMKTQTAKVKAVAERLNRPGGLVQWTVSATLQPSITNGYFKDEITLITNDSPPQTIPISVVANVQSAVSVTPSIINFGPIRAGQSVSKVVHVRSSSAILAHQDRCRPDRAPGRRAATRFAAGPYGQPDDPGPAPRRARSTASSRSRATSRTSRQARSRHLRRSWRVRERGRQRCTLQCHR